MIAMEMFQDELMYIERFTYQYRPLFAVGDEYQKELMKQWCTAEMLLSKMMRELNSMLVSFVKTHKIRN